jgi:hypothetical protein
MEAEVRYTATGVPTGLAAEVRRRAVLEPLVGPAETSREITRATMRLVELWRARIAQLARAGLPEFAGASADAMARWALAANCPPGFVRQEPPGRPCRLRGLCPFCWAREVETFWRPIDRTFRRSPDLKDTRRSLSPTQLDRPGRSPAARAAVAAALAAVTDPRSRSKRKPKLLPPPDGHDLLQWTSASTLPRREVDPATGRPRATLPAWIDAMTDMGGRRDRFICLFGCPGAFEALGVGIGQGAWALSIARLLVIPTGTGLPEYWRHVLPEGEVRIDERPAREAVLEAVARACRYPVDLLLHEDLAAVLELRAARRGRRLRMAMWDFAGSAKGLG